jgi:hypothetical protein
MEAGKAKKNLLPEGRKSVESVDFTLCAKALRGPANKKGKPWIINLCAKLQIQ